MSADHCEGTFTRYRGLKLYYQGWRPKAPAGAVGVIHGVGEHSGRYGNVVDALVPRGFSVYGFDLRGHGRSPGRRIHIDRWDEYREDADAFLRLLRELQPGVPLFVYGHSMGALILAESLTRSRPDVSGAVISGIPLMPAGVAKAHLVAIARVLSRIVPTFSLSLNLDHGALSRDPEVVRAYGSDPLVTGRVSVRWGMESLAAVERVKSAASGIATPILLIHGEADRLNLAEGSRRLYETASSPDKELRLYPGGYHEVHNDLDKNTVLSDVADWLLRHLQLPL